MYYNNMYYNNMWNFGKLSVFSHVTNDASIAAFIDFAVTAESCILICDLC